MRYFPRLWGECMKTFLDWSAYDTYGIGDAYSGIPATGGNYAKAVAVCMHSRDCQNTGKGVMCPSFRITGERKHSTEARVAAFKAALNDGTDARAFADPRLDEAMDLCVSCKACKKECPSSVDMTLIKTEYLAQRHEILGVPRRTWLFGALPEWAGRHRAWLRFAIGLRNRSKWSRAITSKNGLASPPGVPYRCQPKSRSPASPQVGWPRAAKSFCSSTLSAIISIPRSPRPPPPCSNMQAIRSEIAKPAPGDAEPDRPLCCGRTYLTTGMVKQARHEGERVLAAFRGEIAAQTPIIGLEPSCLLSLRDELYSLGLGQEVGELGKQLYLIEEFLAREHQNKGLRLNLKPLDLPKALLHGHCHQKAFGVMKATRKVLNWIPGFSYDIVETSCCGMAGSFGLEAEHYDASLQMAEISLLPAVRAAGSDAPIIANGFSCRHQIEHGSGRQAVHTAVLLRDALVLN